MKFLYTTIIYCDRIYPRHYPPFLPLPLISSFLSIIPFPTLCPSIFGDPMCLHGAAFTGAQVRGYLQKHRQLGNSYTTEENVSSTSGLRTSCSAASEAY